VALQGPAPTLGWVPHPCSREEDSLLDPALGSAAPPPLRPYAESALRARWTSDVPLVSVLCATYQHIEFIEDALRGFVGQVTDFPFEVIVRDDASTDGTAEVVARYAEQYPNIIRPVLETRNRWQEMRPGEVLHPLARGRFLASCEGDDYWIADDHLQRSVDALLSPARPVATVARCVGVRDGSVVSFEEPDPQQRWNYYLPVRSLVRDRSVPVPRIEGVAGDMALALTLQRSGTVAVVGPTPAAVHVLHAGGIHGGLTYAGRKVANVEQLLRIAVHLAEAGDVELAEQYRAYAEIKVRKVLRDHPLP
jgi:hypothetical protein